MKPAFAVANTDFLDPLEGAPTEPPTVDQLRRAVLQQGQATISALLHGQLQRLERSDLHSTITMRDGELKVLELPTFKPLPQRPRESFAALQEWEGVITAVTDKLVYASLVDVTGGGKTLEETAEIPIEEVADDDRSRLVRGAVFRWAIGYLRMTSGTKMRASVIYFRRSSMNESVAKVPPLVFENP